MPGRGGGRWFSLLPFPQPLCTAVGRPIPVPPPPPAGEPVDEALVDEYHARSRERGSERTSERE